MSRQYADEEILEMLRSCKEKHGKCTTNKFRDDDEFCSVPVVIDRFGSWSKAFEEAGIESEKRSGYEYSEEVILSQLREVDRKHGKCTTTLLGEEEGFVSPSVVIDRFGSWSEAKRAAGIEVDQREQNARPQQYSDEELLDHLREHAEANGSCTQRSFDNDPDRPSSGVIRKRFGTWSEAKEKAGIDVAGAGNTRYTKSELLEMLQECEDEYGNCTAERFSEDDRFCSPETVQRRFGSWNEAKRRARNQINLEPAESSQSTLEEIEASVRVSRTEDDEIQIVIDEETAKKLAGFIQIE